MSSAIISPCGTYRYELRRRVPCALRWIHPAVFVLFNPSTADHVKDDQTVKKGLGFCERWSCTEMVFVNLYAFRSSKPKKLWGCDDPIGPENNDHLRRVLKGIVGGRLFFAWGAIKGPKMKERVQTICDIVSEMRVQPEALVITKEGFPGHPVMLPYALTPVPIDMDKLVGSYKK